MVIVGQILYQLPAGSKVYAGANDDTVHESLCVYEQPEKFSEESAYNAFISRIQAFATECKTGPGLDTFLMVSSREPLNWAEFCNSRAEMYVDADHKNSKGETTVKVILLDWYYKSGGVYYDVYRCRCNKYKSHRA